MAVGALIAGTVIDVLPNDLYRIELATGQTVIASLGGAVRQGLVRVLPGELVEIEISTRDPSRGKIKRRLS